jgi:hypothetical protein
MKRRLLSRESAKELLLADAVAGLNDEKTGRAISEAEFRRRFDDEDERKGRQRTHRIHGPLN